MIDVFKLMPDGNWYELQLGPGAVRADIRPGRWLDLHGKILGNYYILYLYINCIITSEFPATN